MIYNTRYWEMLKSRLKHVVSKMADGPCKSQLKTRCSVSKRSQIKVEDTKQKFDGGII